MKTRSDSKKKKNYGKLTVVLVVMIVLVTTLNIPCYITQYEKNYEARTLTEELNDEVNRGKRLLIEYKSRVNYKLVEDYVTENLNMKKLENYQIEYISKSADDMSVVVKNDDDNGFLSRIANTFSIIAEYFR